jgi:hypothetical protein
LPPDAASAQNPAKVSNTLSHGTLAGEIMGTGEPGLKGITVFARVPH